MIAIVRHGIKDISCVVTRGMSIDGAVGLFPTEMSQRVFEFWPTVHGKRFAVNREMRSVVR